MVCVIAEAESAYAKERIQQTEGPISEEGLLVFFRVQPVRCLPLSGPIRNNCCLRRSFFSDTDAHFAHGRLGGLLEAEERG
jgi:hypothetical protein